MMGPGQLKLIACEKARAYYDAAHHRKPFIPGETQIPVAGRVYDWHEIWNLVDAS
ncbi:unnamed protein product, partial [marine sediment metagenome]